MNPSIKIAVQLTAQGGDFATLRARWLKAEELGADALYATDHLNAIVPDTEFMTHSNDGSHSHGSGLNVFEGSTIQAAMAATTTRPQIGCVVMANPYRNPNMTAYIAGTIDQISGGRFILGLGTGFFSPDFEEFGYEYGTQRSRSEALARDVPVILARLGKLTPPPARRIPLMIASMGPTIGLPLVARHADIWHAYGSYDKLASKWEALQRICSEHGRDASEIEFATYYMPWILNGPHDTLDDYAALGCRQIIAVADGPDWDLGPLREALQWRDARERSASSASRGQS